MLSSQVYDSFDPQQAQEQTLQQSQQQTHQQAHQQTQQQQQQPSHALLRCFFATAEAQMQRALTFTTSSGCGVSNRYHPSTAPSLSAAGYPRMERTSSAGGKTHHTSCTDPTDTLASHVMKGLLKIIAPDCLGSSHSHSTSHSSLLPSSDSRKRGDSFR